jgi:hypothetical protein
MVKKKIHFFLYHIRQLFLLQMRHIKRLCDLPKRKIVNHVNRDELEFIIGSYMMFYETSCVMKATDSR